MRIVAVLASYRPDLAVLETNLAALLPQVDGLVLVDDGSPPEDLAALARLVPAPHRFLPLHRNEGLAHAQNAGIAEARALGADAVLLMDQDSRPAPGMVAALSAALALRAADRPAVIGAGYDEPHRGADAALPAPQRTDAGDAPEMEAVIASGSLIPLPAFEAVGPFDEGLFIDFVDTEWCFRARAAGWRCFAARQARMTHRIGDGTLRLAGRARTVHGPDRMYYQIRNLLLLARRPATPRRWLWRKLPRTLARGLVLALLVPPRLSRLRAVARGLWHGLTTRSGPA